MSAIINIQLKDQQEPVDLEKDNSSENEVITISQEAADLFREFLKKNQEYLKQSAGVFHTDNHSNW